MPKSAPRKKAPLSALFTLAFIMLINALAYGVIIPLLYPYAQRFGIGPLGLSMLFATFSLAQFISTPILGRLSDRYGRKPLLVISMLGTSLALGTFALATNIWMLFASRLVDGITGGNISIAQAMLADLTEGKDRARAFGLLGASFGVGFLLGPTLGGLLSTIHITAPFWLATALASLATLFSAIFLKETGRVSKRESRRESLFNFGHLIHALASPVTGMILLVSLISAVANNAWIIGFQSFSVDLFKMSARDTGLIFAGAGVVNILMQAGGIRLILKIFRTQQRVLVSSLFFSTLVSLATAFARTPFWFTVGIFSYMIAFAPLIPMVTALLSEKTKREDQGAILGINQSYVSLGQIIGPLIAGGIASFSVPGIFVMIGGTMGIAWVMGIHLRLNSKKVDL